MKTIFLTGASSGIGRAIAERLCAAGHQVWGTSRDPGRIPSLARLHPVRLDLSDFDSLPQAFEKAWHEAGGIDVLINNAGSGHFDTAEALSPQKVEELFRILVLAQMELCRLALIAMKGRQTGLIINVTSLASRLPVPFMAIYNAGKAALASYTFTLQLELGDRRVQVVDLQPADICTDFNDAISRSTSGEARVVKAWEVVDRNMRNAPKPDLVAQSVLRLIELGNPPPRVTIGDFFQSRMAPLIFRFLPQRVRVWGLRRYYGI